MSSYLVLIFLLGITAFYIFLGIYLVTHLIAATLRNHRAEAAREAADKAPIPPFPVREKDQLAH